MTDVARPTRFALLRHKCPTGYRNGPHWDLLIERPNESVERRLATWALDRLPDTWPALLGRKCETCREAVGLALPDHRAAYLDYEGSVSGDRGSVERWDGGPVEWVDTAPDRLAVRLLPPALLAGALWLRRRADDQWSVEWSCDSPRARGSVQQ